MLESRPIFHQEDETIRGHVFCSFLALLLHHELKERLKPALSLSNGKQANHFEWACPESIEWDAIRRDLESLAEVEVREGEQWYLLRTALQGVTGKVLQSVGVAVPPPVRPLQVVVPKN